MTGPPPDASAVREQLEAILASRIFLRSERLRRMLSFIVEQTLDGRSQSIKEQVLACELYGKGKEFDNTVDASVRVDARRLRDKLREYYAEHLDAPIVISLPRGGYVPIFERRPAADSPRMSGSAAVGASRAIIRRFTVMIAIAAVIAGGLTWFRRQSPAALPRLVPLTAYPGNETWPSLSPDGTLVAFVCPSPDSPDSPDICIKEVGTEVLRRVAVTPAGEHFPSWSPDGRRIAFSRSSGGKPLGVYITSVLGGDETKIADTGTIVGWTASGTSILIRDRNPGEPFRIVRVDLESRERHPLTTPEDGAGDWSFAVSPSGETLAFIRHQRPGAADLYVMSMRGGPERRLTHWNSNVAGPAWTPDGNELLYSVNDRLWRVPVNGASSNGGSPIPNIPMAAGSLSMSRPGIGQAARLVFHSPQQQIRLRRVDLASTDTQGRFQHIAPFAPATRKDAPGRFSPDGRRVTFTSTRSSSDYELWIADSDGTNIRQLTFFGTNRGMLAHSWSPDGRRILFDTSVAGNSDLFVIPREGGSPERLTSSIAVEALADWSPDGQWIYYTVIASGSDIWRIPASGGQAKRITSTGGSEPQLSPDGRYLYYLDQPPIGAAIRGRLMRTTAAGGDSKFIYDNISPTCWSVTDKGIYFLKDESNVHVIYLYRFNDEKVSPIGSLPFRVTNLQRPGRLTVSRDGRWALVNVTDANEGDLMLVENFR